MKELKLNDCKNVSGANIRPSQCVVAAAYGANLGVMYSAVAIFAKSHMAMPLPGNIAFFSIGAAALQAAYQISKEVEHSYYESGNESYYK